MNKKKREESGNVWPSKLSQMKLWWPEKIKRGPQKGKEKPNCSKGKKNPDQLTWANRPPNRDPPSSSREKKKENRNVACFSVPQGGVGFRGGAAKRFSPGGLWNPVTERATPTRKYQRNPETGLPKIFDYGSGEWTGRAGKR